MLMFSNIAAGNTGRRWPLGIAIFLFVCIILTGGNFYRASYHGEVPLQPVSMTSAHLSEGLDWKKFQKPQNGKVVGLIFFGRKDRVEILLPYIERNLVDSGGWLDEVIWVQNTENKDDIEYLEEILPTSRRYKKFDTRGTGIQALSGAWGSLESGNYYIKIDDDVVWFGDDVIPRLVTTKAKNQQALVVSANVINSPVMGWVQYHMGALHPYLPEINTNDSSSNSPVDIPTRKPWKYTEYPYWQGPDDYTFDIQDEPPYNGHRWLRLKNDADIGRTPISKIEYDAEGTGLKSWAIAAQEHYSFLENLAENRLDRYRFAKSWVTDYMRLSINVIAVWADDIIEHLPIDSASDERWLTMDLPKRLQRSVVVDGEALAVHFTFGPQRKAEQTDLLARYRDYTMEFSKQKRVP